MGYEKKMVPASAIPVVAGDRKTVPLQSKVRTHLVAFTFGATVDVTTDFTSSRNRGSVLALWDEMGINADGEDRFIIDPRSARTWSEVNAPSALPKVRSANLVAAGPVEALRETVYLFMANPRIARQEETAFMERDVRQEMQAFAKYNGLASKLYGGAGVAAITAPFVRVRQLYDPLRQELPLLRPAIRQIVASVPAANSAQEVSLKGSRYIGGILIQQDSDAGEVTDIINNVSVLGDDGRDIWPRPLPFADLVEMAASEAGGDVSTSAAYLPINFLTDGRLNRVVHPYAYANLRLVLDVQPSVVAGATNSKVRVTLFEYDRDSELTAATLPFTI